eukprot:TRINITY_DN7978_c0_g1::TRINITY_DN7978_c0_g1_i1::g.15581::m.15581 TRINITY_DN7978_c0_g1::TRINITY_DN7978_c0_g1_i1::g.15581  ORF type:complete len:302 (+),score=42.59 TRINITY_DN7978_c0_g1_i1:26-907(+)
MSSKIFIALLGVFSLLSLGLVSSIEEGATQPSEHAAPVLFELRPIHYDASFLLDHLDNHPAKAESPQLAHELAEVKTELKSLIGKLFVEETKLNALKSVKRSLKRKAGWTWFFNADSRLKIEKADLDIRDQARMVHNIFDDISFLWKKAKPHYGVFSKMFLDEVFSIFPYTMMLIWDIIETMLAVGLISLIIGGPAFAIFVWSVFTAFGFVVPILIALPVFSLMVYYMITLPSMIVQYNPSLGEFCAVYFPTIAVLGGVAAICLRSIIPRPAITITRTVTSSGPGRRIPIKVE